MRSGEQTIEIEEKRTGRCRHESTQPGRRRRCIAARSRRSSRTTPAKGFFFSVSAMISETTNVLTPK